jgi:subtilisin family serine protease
MSVRAKETMMKKTALSSLSTLLVLMLTSALASADSRFIIRTDPANVSTIAQKYGLSYVRTLDTQNQVVLVSVPDSVDPAAMEAQLEADPSILTCEEDATVAFTAGPAKVTQSTTAILDGLLKNATVANYFGDPVLSLYVDQPATRILHLKAEQTRLKATGSGIVAVIDTGVDPTHPVLADSLLPGYDFVHDWSGTASEWADVDQSTTAILDQSTTAILDQSTTAILDQSTTAILDQSTTAILDTTKLPKAFGHGTMVSGIVHLVAPTAQILPLKAFSSDGTGNLSDIVRAIYYAVDNGATVINMSFTFDEPSTELTNAINYATRHGVIIAAAAGNTGDQTPLYPAALPNVLSIASTDNFDVRSVFSTYGSTISFAAPGEGVVTLYPGGHYAAVWGTSFSTPMVAGVAAVLDQVQPNMSFGDVIDNLKHGKSIPALIGKARIDVYGAVIHAY